LTAFGTPLVGDTLFGQLCWILRRRQGEERLASLLEGYTQGHPFAVLSDAFPRGFLPLPALSSRFWGGRDEGDRKKWKAKRWLKAEHLTRPLPEWPFLACSDPEAFGAGAFGKETSGKETSGEEASGPVARSKGQALPVDRALPAPRRAMRARNTINRLTGTTGKGFAPFVQAQMWHHPAAVLDLYAVLDESRLSLSELQAALSDLGAGGYGRDASAGLGKFRLEGEGTQPVWASAPPGRFWLTLANCAPHGLGYEADRSWYRLTTRFGRHGDVAALGPVPFKQPLQLALPGAVFSLAAPGQRQFLGQGAGGVSRSDPGAVHQGYAPVAPLPDFLPDVLQEQRG
jgi:CRISPR-associated protein Csm4